MDDLQAYKNGVIKQKSVQLSEQSNPNLSDTERSLLESVRNHKMSENNPRH